MKDKKLPIAALVLLLLGLLAWKSWNNPTIWEWISSFSIAVLIFHFGFAAYHLYKRWPTHLESELMLDCLIVASLLGAILTIPFLKVTNGFIAFLFYFISVRHYGLINKSSGLKKRFAIKLNRIEAPMAPIFAVFCALGFLVPTIFHNP